MKESPTRPLSQDGDPEGRRPHVVLRDVRKEYHRGQELVAALDGVDLELRRGEMVALSGPSGSGKSTLLHILGALDRPTSGVVTVAGTDLADLSEEQATSYRRSQVGIVFQFFNLIPSMSAWENISLPGLLFGGPGRSTRERRRRAGELLDQVGLADHRDHRPGQLSGGQMQRVAIARALYSDPEMILADEPTGNLDSEAAGAVLDLLREVRSSGRLVLMVTHDPIAVSLSDRELTMRDGRVTPVPATEHA